jgi:hypothetical protein
MGEVLQWQRNNKFPHFSSRVPDTAGSRPLTADMATKVLELGPGGSLAGTDDAEIQRKALEANPMRRVARWACRTCDFEWLAPSAGACPSCHKSQPELLDEHINMAQRLK